MGAIYEGEDLRVAMEAEGYPTGQMWRSRGPTLVALFLP